MARQERQDFSCALSSFNNENKVIEMLLEISHVQWFAVKNDCRKLITEGRLQLIKTPQKLANEIKQEKQIDNHTKSANNLILHDMLILMFVDNNNYQYEIDKSFPILKVSDRNYLFPSLKHFFGLVIDFRINSEILYQFEELLKQYGQIKTSAKTLKIHDLPYDETIQISPSDAVAEIGNKIAHCIRKKTIMLTAGIRRSSTFATESIQKGRDKLKEHIKQEEERQIDPQVHANLIKAQLATKAMVAVSGAVVTGATAAANAFSNGLTDSLSKTEVGQKLIVNEGPKVKAAKDIVKSTVAGFCTVYDEIVQAGLVIIRETGSSIAHIVEHKYGSSAGRAARCAAEVVDGAASTAVNVSRLSTASLAKRIVKNTTIDMLSNEEEKKMNRSSRLVIDPLTGLQVMSVVGQLGNISQEVTNQNRSQRFQYIGMNDSNLNNVNNINNKPSTSETELLKLDLD